MTGGPDWLAQQLRDLRAAAGVSGWTAGRHIGKTQRRISDIERGVYNPTGGEVLALAELYHVTPEMRRQLVDAVAGQRSVPRSYAAAGIVAQGIARMQERFRRIERDSAVIREFHPVMVIGLLQTPDYMRAVFSQGGEDPAEVERAVAKRMERQQILTSGRQVTLLHTEGALRWHAVSPALMAAQLDHVIAVSHRNRVGVIPWTRPAGVFPPNAFSLYDERQGTVGTWHRTYFVGSREVAEYSRLFTDLSAVAAWDGEARAHLERIAADYRRLL